MLKDNKDGKLPSASEVVKSMLALVAKYQKTMLLARFTSANDCSTVLEKNQYLLSKEMLGVKGWEERDREIASCILKNTHIVLNKRRIEKNEAGKWGEKSPLYQLLELDKPCVRAPYTLGNNN